jgi:branched-subunit amino acid transport protein
MTLREILLIAGMVAVTFAVRYVPLVMAGRLRLPRIVETALRYVPVAVLTAITVPAVLMPQGTLQVELGNPYLFGSLAAILVAWFTRRLLPTIAGGMAVFLFWKLVVAA